MSIEILLTQEFASLHLNTRSWRHERNTVLLYQPRNIRDCGLMACDTVWPSRRLSTLRSSTQLLLTEEFAVDLGSFFALGKAECPLFVASNGCIPVKNMKGW